MNALATTRSMVNGDRSADMIADVAKSWFIFKVAQRCNINCKYCYVYNRGDDSWSTRPKIMSPEVARGACDAIRVYAKENNVNHITIEIHGGEPLLIGHARFDELLSIIKSELVSIAINFVLQTNGIKLDEEFLDLFEKHNVRFGVSIDGPPSIADIRRRDFLNRPTTERVLNRIVSLRRHRAFNRQFSGALCVICPEHDGAQTVNWFASHGFKSVSFLLPDGNFANPPPDFDSNKLTSFLISAFDEWSSKHSTTLDIRLFRQILLSFMGVSPGLDSLGEDLRSMVVIETNGALGPHDVLRICGNTFSLDTLSVSTENLSRLNEFYKLNELQRPSSICKTCNHYKSCRGGYLPHRFDGAGFGNPSFHCATLFALCDHVQNYLQGIVPAHLWRETKLTPAFREVP